MAKWWLPAATCRYQREAVDHNDCDYDISASLSQRQIILVESRSQRFKFGLKGRARKICPIAKTRGGKVRFPGHSVPTFSISVFFLPSRVQSIVLCSFGPWVPIHHMSLTPLTQTMVQSWACLLFCISYLSYSFSLFVPCDPLAVWIGAKLSQFSQGFAYSITTSPRADNSTTHVQRWDTASSFTTCWRWHELLW